MKTAIFLGGQMDQEFMRFPGKLQPKYLAPVKLCDRGAVCFSVERYLLRAFATKHGDINVYIYDGIIGG